jgi:hypothetical protein
MPKWYGLQGLIIIITLLAAAESAALRNTLKPEPAMHHSKSLRNPMHDHHGCMSSNH